MLFRLGVFLLLPAVPILARDLSGSPASHCDPMVQTDLLSATGYQDRGDRCEGRYSLSNVGASDLVVLAFGAFPPGTQTPDTLELCWASSLVEGVARLTGTSLGPEDTYRVDHRVAAQETSFRWNTTILRSAQLHSSEIGFIITSHRQVAGHEQLVYLPLASGTPCAAAPTNTTVFTLRLTGDFNSLRWRILALGGPAAAPSQAPKWVDLPPPLLKRNILRLAITTRRGGFQVLQLAGYQANGLPLARDFYLCFPDKT